MTRLLMSLLACSAACTTPPTPSPAAPTSQAMNDAPGSAAATSQPMTNAPSPAAAGTPPMANAPSPAAVGTLAAPTPPTGAATDFAYFEGGWNTHQRRLRVRGKGSDQWDEFPGTLCARPYLGGMVTVDELAFPTKGWSGLTVRAFDAAKRTWSVYWINSKTGVMGTPVQGGFTGPRGEFYGTDTDDGHPVVVRYRWNKIDASHARWEQAFSPDGTTWETNWTADFVRADTGTVCANGRPTGGSPAR